MRNEALELSVRLDAAKAAAPFVHPRLQAVDARVGIHHTVASRQLSETEMRELITVIDAADDELPPLLPGPER
jgi:hypothetical protein